MDHTMHDMQTNHSQHLEAESTPIEYVKLALVIISVLVLSFLAQRYVLDGQSFMSVFMGFFFIVFASFKLLDLKSFAEAYSGYDVIAKHSIKYAYTYPFIELALGIGSLLALGVINYFIVLFMAIGSIGVVKELFSNRKFRCACLGAFIKLPLTTVSLTEDLVMLIMALILILK